MTHVTCRLTAKNRDQLRNLTLGNRVWATFTFFWGSPAERESVRGCSICAVCGKLLLRCLLLQAMRRIARAVRRATMHSLRASVALVPYGSSRCCDQLYSVPSNCRWALCLQLTELAVGSVRQTRLSCAGFWLHVELAPPIYRVVSSGRRC